MIFFHQCVNMVWKGKSNEGPSLSVLHSFYKHSVDDVATNACDLYFKMCCYYRWGFFLTRHSFKCSSLLLIWYFLQLGKVLDTWFVHVSLGRFFVCQDLGPSILYLFPLLLGALFYWWFTGFHQGEILDKNKEPPNTGLQSTHGKWPLNNHTRQHVAPTRYEAHQINVPLYR
jgi:hypothetical protein